jgi:hypothetical protein
MSDHGDDLERHLADALAARANAVEPSGTDSLDRIEQRVAAEHSASSNRRRLFLGLGAAAAIVAIVAAVAVLRNDDKQAVTVVPAASESTTTSTTTTTTTTTSPATTSPTVRAAAVPHIGPLDASTFSTPEEAARSFAVDYLGMTNARLGQTIHGEPASGTNGPPVANVEVFPNARSNARTTVNTVQTADGWVVTGANADLIVVDTPKPHDPVTQLITVSGQGTAFEGQLGVELRPLESSTVLATGTAMAGANGEMGPFTTTIGPPSTDQPVVLVVFEGDASGEQTMTYATVVLLGA